MSGEVVRMVSVMVTVSPGSTDICQSAAEWESACSGTVNSPLMNQPAQRLGSSSGATAPTVWKDCALPLDVSGPPTYRVVPGSGFRFVSVESAILSAARRQKLWMRPPLCSYLMSNHEPGGAKSDAWKPPCRSAVAVITLWALRLIMATAACGGTDPGSPSTWAYPAISGSLIWILRASGGVSGKGTRVSVSASASLTGSVVFCAA
ncbi:MAG: hypothetical protein BWY63_03576 [Chloroflexi bacterium ADurb.Bin360]|nr:MAG: hypothetical protein BWY63_03576 [Chloroflexi bacterium ADurb.Bin360]